MIVSYKIRLLFLSNESTNACTHLSALGGIFIASLPIVLIHILTNSTSTSAI